MAFSSVADLLEAYAKAGELARIAVPVEPELEMAEIARRSASSDGPALLFERVAGHNSAVVANLFTSQRRLCMALGVDSVEAFVERLAGLAENAGQTSWLDRLSGRSDQQSLARFAPKVVKVGASQQVVKLGRDIDLEELPALRSWPSETHRTISAGQLLVVDSRTTARVAERCPVVVIGRDRLLPLVATHGAAAHQFAAARQSGQAVPVVLTLGGSPAEMLLGDLPLDNTIDCYALAGLLNERPLPVVTARTQPLEVPAEAEIVIEAEFDPTAGNLPDVSVATESGFYAQFPASDATEPSVLRVTAVTHRANAAFPVVVRGAAGSGSTAIELLLAGVLLPIAQSVAAEVVDLALPAFGRRDFLIVSIDKTFPQQAAKVAQALSGHPALMTVRTMVVVDRGVDVHQTDDVLFRVAANLRGARDLHRPAGPVRRFAHAEGKLVLDATAKLPGECDGQWPAEATSDPDTQELVDRRWSEYGLG